MVNKLNNRFTIKLNNRLLLNLILAGLSAMYFVTIYKGLFKLRLKKKQILIPCQLQLID